jgi:hypothetical protein
MTAYNKRFAAIISTLLMRWALQWFGFDATALGVDEDIRMLVSLGLDAAVAGVNGFFVWLIPNISKQFD